MPKAFPVGIPANISENAGVPLIAPYCFGVVPMMVSAPLA
jgi:hypothetical protein